jgi:hypothetical protein
MTTFSFISQSTNTATFLNSSETAAVLESSPNLPDPGVISDVTQAVTAIVSGSSPNLPDPGALKTLEQLSPLLTVCLTLCVLSYKGVEVLKQVNHFIELLKGK